MGVEINFKDGYLNVSPPFGTKGIGAGGGYYKTKKATISVSPSNNFNDKKLDGSNLEKKGVDYNSHIRGFV